MPRANTVNRDVQVFNHEVGIAITTNRIDGNLQCKENVPAPPGGGNRVQGNTDDQCKGLQAAQVLDQPEPDKKTGGAERTRPFFRLGSSSRQPPEKFQEGQGAAGR